MCEICELKEEIERLKFELKAAKSLIDGSVIEALKPVIEQQVNLQRENDWLMGALVTLIRHVNKRDLDNVVRISAAVEHYLDDGEGDHAVH